MNKRAASEKKRAAKYRNDVKNGLQNAYDAEETETESLDLETDQIIIFSDHHKGARDGADDFQRCERAYDAALRHYREHGYELYILGDAEELWEVTAKRIIKAYSQTLNLEAEFHSEERYMRFWGNHDDLWRNPLSVKKHLDRIFNGLRVREALRITVRAAGDELGTLFLLHGHQGTTWSDKLGWLSRFFVRYFWRNIQRLLHVASTTPATDHKLRGEHNRAMYEWARDKNEDAGPLILIAGHTHKPVFMAPAGELRNEVHGAQHANLVEAELEQVRQLNNVPDFNQAGENQSVDEINIYHDQSCYFNTGCCSYGDGAITGLEIADGKIRLVRWWQDEIEGEELITQDIRAEANLRNVFASLGAPPVAADRL